MTILADVKALGQQIWLDNLSRSLVRSGELAQWLQDGVCGVTSNPAIFQKAFAGDALYQDDIAKLKAAGHSAKAVYETLAVEDVQAACDVCLPEYQSSGGNSGFVSLEVSPEWSRDTAATVAEAVRLHQAIARPNAMIKVPATDEGITAMRELVAKGISVNLTLLFSRRQTLKAYDAYVAGLQQAQADGVAIAPVRMVASFFISRVDSALDPTLPEALRGKAALALARAAYADWAAYFSGAAWQPLADAGAAKVRLLWASTGVKNPDYRDTLYVDELIGRDTVNTVPDATLKAFVDHGTAALTLTEQADEAHAVLAELERLGIDVETLASRLQDDGLKQFEEAFDKLLAPLA